MRLPVVLLAVVGVLGGFLLVFYYGIGAVGAALEVAGWSGLAAITLFHFLPLWLCALAWRALLRPPSAGVLRYCMFRLARDTGGLLPAGGPLLGIRAMHLAGIDVNRAAASTVVDCTLEMAAQLLFTLCGLAILLMERRGGAALLWALAAMAVLGLLLLAFALVQRHGAFRLLAHHGADLSWFPLTRIGAIRNRVNGIYADRRRVLGAFALHFLAWLVSIGEAGIGLYLLGSPLGLGPLLALESLGCAVRGVAFVIPGAAGVQEAGYVLLGALFGVGPEVALSLSLLKRGRELLLTGLGFVLWQGHEGDGAYRRLHPRAATGARRKEP